MTNETFTALERQLTQSIKQQGETLKRQLMFAKRQYKFACENYGNSSPQAGRWDKLACALSYAVDALDVI